MDVFHVCMKKTIGQTGEEGQESVKKNEKYEREKT